nr:MAG TPA: hypothetical protein [Caudoviricetes sp.]DAO48777.1 MAG TPA: hypothetical protein [Caudoviricetes sp.]
MEGGDGVMEYTPHDYQRHCINRIIDTPKLGLFLD